LKKLADRALCLAAWEYEEANSGHQLRQLGPRQLLRLLTHEHLAVTSDGRIYRDLLDWCAHAAEKVSHETKKDIMLKLLQHQRWDIFLCLPVCRVPYVGNFLFARKAGMVTIRLINYHPYGTYLPTLYGTVHFNGANQLSYGSQHRRMQLLRSNLASYNRCVWQLKSSMGNIEISALKFIWSRF
jgi:hypothetical protein